MVRLPGRVSPLADLTAITNSSFPCWLVPVRMDNECDSITDQRGTIRNDDLTIVQSRNQTSGYMETYFTISLVAMEMKRSIIVLLCMLKSFLNSNILSRISEVHSNPSDNAEFRSLVGQPRAYDMSPFPVS